MSVCQNSRSVKFFYTPGVLSISSGYTIMIVLIEEKIIVDYNMDMIGGAYMAQDMLSAKLGELDDRLWKLHSRILISCNSSHSQLCREIEALKLEYAEEETTLRSKLKLSKSAYVSVLSRNYERMEQLIKDTEAQLEAAAAGTDAAFQTEAKLLLAEYALDFAYQAADRALLISMDAIDSELLEQEN